MHRAIRLGSLIAFLIGVGIYLYRAQKTPEQSELTAYVEGTLPRLESTEIRIDEQLVQLTRAPGLAPPAARALLVDEIIPSLLALRKQAAERKYDTEAVKALARSYDEVVLAQIEACRTAVRVIDDSTLDTKTAAAKVRSAFVEAGARRKMWKAEIEAACKAQGLLRPTKPGIPGKPVEP